jgi:glyoxylate utilization-related uncharacterized protein
MEVEITKEQLHEKRIKSLDMINRIIEQKEIERSEGVWREVIHVGSQAMAFLVFGHRGDCTTCNEVDYTRSLFLIEGSIQITFDTGRTVVLTGTNEYLMIPKGSSYSAKALENDTAVSLKMVR